MKLLGRAPERCCVVGVRERIPGTSPGSKRRSRECGMARAEAEAEAERCCRGRVPDQEVSEMVMSRILLVCTLEMLGMRPPSGPLSTWLRLLRGAVRVLQWLIYGAPPAARPLPASTQKRVPDFFPGLTNPGHFRRVRAPVVGWSQSP